MQLISYEQQLKEGRSNLRETCAVMLKSVFDYCFKNITSPGVIPENMAVIRGYLAISFLFLLDIFVGPEVSIHVLYLFPLIFVALHCSQSYTVTGAVALSILCQLIELIGFHHQAFGNQIYLLLLIPFSNIICALVVRYVRTNMLEARHLSSIDPLTQLNNRRVLNNAIDTEVVRRRRYGGQFSVAMIDLDGFKGLNDSMGHKAGDRALVLVADILRSQTRQSDTLARLGGDEFVVLMPNTQASDCHALCHLLCHAIDRKMMEEFSYPVTASIGFTTIEDCTDDSVDILSVADRAMYQAKSNGKGCVRGYVEEFTEKEFGKK